MGAIQSPATHTQGQSLTSNLNQVTLALVTRDQLSPAALANANMVDITLETSTLSPSESPAGRAEQPSPLSIRLVVCRFRPQCYITSVTQYVQPWSNIPQRVLA